VCARQKVRAELTPWEARINAARSAADVAGAERDLLLQQQEARQTRLRVRSAGVEPVLRAVVSTRRIKCHDGLASCKLWQRSSLYAVHDHPG